MNTGHQYQCVHSAQVTELLLYKHTYIHEGKDEAMASRGVIFQSVAGRESGVTVLVVSFAIFISTRPDLRDFLTSIRSVQNYNRFLVYLTIYRSIEI